MVVPPITLLLGSEVILRDEIISSISSELFKNPSDKKLNFHSFDVSKDKLKDIISDVMTTPFLSDKRLVVVNNIDSLSQADKKSLLGALESNPSHLIWVLMSSERSAKSAFLKNISKLGKSIVCAAPYKEGEIRLWIKNRFLKYKKQIDSQAMMLLHEKVGNQLSFLANAIEQLVVYVDKKDAVNVDDVRELLGDSGEKNIFELYEFLKQKKFDKALQIVLRFKTEGKRSYEIISSLAWQFNRVLQIKNLLAQGMGESQIASRMGMHPYFAKITVQKIQRINGDVLKRDLKTILDCEHSIKSGELKEDLALDRCILGLQEV